MRKLFRLDGTLPRHPAVERWLAAQDGELGGIASRWLARLRDCGTDVGEVMHDGFPTLCVEDAAFSYVAVFKAHVNVGFFQGAELPDPARLLQGEGRYMRHVKLRPGALPDARALEALVTAAHADVRARLRQEAKSAR